MRFRIASIVLFSLIFLGTTFATVAWAAGGGGEDAPTQTPVQVIVQIVITGIVLKFLRRFDLP